jgi:tRNA(Ile)-lysidine synthase
VGSTLNKKSLLHCVHQVIASRQLLRKGATVLVGVSAGPDSVALLHVLWQLRYKLGIKIMAAHFNHRLRKEASADEEFVRNLSARLKVPFVCGRASGNGPKGSVEDWARRQRLDFMVHAAGQQNARAVALAHTRDDLAETVLMRMLRGAGLLGLRGILPERKMDGVNFVRPLLAVRKEDIYAYLKSEKLGYRVDRTNLKADFFRNKIRLKLLPLLQKEYNPSIQNVLANLSDSVSADYDFINEAGARFYSRIVRSSGGCVRLNQKSLDQAHPAMRRMALRTAFEQVKGDLKGLALEHIFEVEDLLDHRPSGSIVHLPGGINVFKSRHMLEFKRK